MSLRRTLSPDKWSQMGQWETWLRLRRTRLGACGWGALGCWTGLSQDWVHGAGSVGLVIPWTGTEQLVPALLVCLAEGLGWKFPVCAVARRGLWSFVWDGGRGPCREKG